MARPTEGRPNREHVVQVVQSIDRGGLEMMSVDLAIALKRRGFESTVVSLTEGGRLESRLADAGVRFELIGGARYWSPLTQLRMMRALRRLGPTAVHTHHLPALLTAGLAARAAGVARVVHTEHACLYLDEEPHARRKLRWAARTADALAVVGTALRPYYVEMVGIPAERVHVVANGIDVERFRPLTAPDIEHRRRAAGIPTDGFVIGAVGRLATVKNYGLLVRAAARARAAGTQVAIVFVGDGEERTHLERLVHDLEIGAETTFLGWRSDVADLVGTFDVLAVTSVSEALPLVVLEAMSAGIPIVSTAVGEIPRVLGYGEAGLLVESEDEHALSDAIARLASNTSLRASLGCTGRSLVSQHYSQSTMVDRYSALYSLR